MRKDATTLAGTAVLGALVVVFDYSLKYSGLKIPFPWLPYLKFDFTGTPIVFSLLLFGLTSGATTSAVAFLAILARSGDVIGASMKALAEFFTVLGMAFGRRLKTGDARPSKVLSIVFGITFRCAIMLPANLLLFPQTATIMISILTVAFNAVQGIISVAVGYLLYNITAHRTSFFGIERRTSQHENLDKKRFFASGATHFLMPPQDVYQRFLNN